MGLLGSAMGRALAGAGSAAADIGNKYIDQQLALQRAQVLEDLRIQSAGKIREQDDAFRNDPTRVARDRANKVADVTAEGGARNQVTLEGERARATDPALRQGMIDTATETAKAGAKAKADVEYDETVKRGTDPLYLKAQKALKEAERQPESAGSLAQAALARAQLAALNNMQAIRQQLAEAVATGNKGAEEALREQLDVFESKPGKADKLRAAIEGAEKTLQGAAKVLNDPMASEPAKKEAEESVRQARVRIDSYSKQLGIDTEKPKAPQAQMHMDAEAAIKSGASRAAVNQRLKEQGYEPLPEPGARARTSLGERAMQKDPGSITGMSEATLRQIAGIQGHAMQAQAQAELKRRESTAEPVDTTGFGFGNR